MSHYSRISSRHQSLDDGVAQRLDRIERELQESRGILNELREEFSKENKADDEAEDCCNFEQFFQTAHLMKTLMCLPTCAQSGQRQLVQRDPSKFNVNFFAPLSPSKPNKVCCPPQPLRVIPERCVPASPSCDSTTAECSSRTPRSYRQYPRLATYQF